MWKYITAAVKKKTSQYCDSVELLIEQLNNIFGSRSTGWEMKPTTGVPFVFCS